MPSWRLKQEVQLARDSGGTILFDVQSGQLYSITPIGSVIVDRLLAGQQLDAVIDELEKAYGQPRARIESDAQGFLQDLARKGLCHASDE
jgi:hypothetical protein